MKEKDDLIAAIASEVTLIRIQGTDRKRALLMGIYQGIGVVLGGIVALLLTGWFLAILGIIPGFDGLEKTLTTAVYNYEHRK